MEMSKKEFLVQEDNTVLKEFIKTNSEQLEALIKDSKKAQVGGREDMTRLLINIQFLALFSHYPVPPSRRPMVLWWSILERTPKPRLLPCFSLSLSASLRHTRSDVLLDGLNDLVVDSEIKTKDFTAKTTCVKFKLLLVS